MPIAQDDSGKGISKLNTKKETKKEEEINLELSLACPEAASVKPLQIIYPDNYTTYEEMNDGFVSDFDEHQEEKRTLTFLSL